MEGPGGFSVFHLHEGDTPTTKVHSRTVHSDGAIRVVLFGFATGEEPTAHAASRPATIRVLSGHCDLT